MQSLDFVFHPFINNNFKKRICKKCRANSVVKMTIVLQSVCLD